jgi:hypothetical protein
MQDYEQVLQRYEHCVTNAVQRGLIGKTERVTLKPNALAATSFGDILGRYIDTEIPFIIDYYGYLKRSIGQEHVIMHLMSKSPTPRFIETTVVHFASLRMNDIVAICPGDFLSCYASFKQFLIANRNFRS